MKKNGFTLTELLGVIIILAVLALVVFPPIISHIKKSKATIDEAVEKLIYSSANLYIDDRENMYLKKDGENYCISIQKLIDERYLQQDIEDADGNLIDTEKEVQIRVGYNKALSYSIVNSGKCVELNSGVMHYLFDGTNVPTISSPSTPPTGHNIYLGLYPSGELAVCIKKGGSEHCFKNNWEAEHAHLERVFSDGNCLFSERNSLLTCSGSSLNCSLYTDNSISCSVFVSGGEYCFLRPDNSVICR